MLDTSVLNRVPYTPVGDILVFSICLLMFLLLSQTLVFKSNNFKRLIGMLSCVALTAFSNILYQTILAQETVAALPAYIFRVIHQASICGMLVLYIDYIKEPLWINILNDKRKRESMIYKFTVAGAILIDIAGTVFGFGFRIHPDGTTSRGLNIYSILILLLSGTIFYMVMTYRTRIIKHVFFVLFASNVMALMIMATQGIHGQFSFTSSAYLIPLLSIIYVFHSNPYDMDTGSVSETLLMRELETNIEKKHGFYMLSCMMPDFGRLIKESTDFKTEFYNFIRLNVNRGVLYRFPNDRMVISFQKRKGMDPDKIIRLMIESFMSGYEKFGVDYRVVILGYSEEIKTNADYISLIEFVEQKMPVNSTYTVSKQDIEDFYGSSYILNQLKDIAHKRDLNDERIKVFCQPVYNIATKRYDTAEALMRLELEKTGMVFPDKFIPLAEQYGLIHTLSLIILNKTCAEVRSLIESGYYIQRVSVNFSALDMRYSGFCDEVRRIIEMNGIPFEKIAVEITESRSEQDFNVMKERVEQLQELGIKFYLDDFGTGYSNFERIMEIPFDIIKFDRSLLIESVKSDSSEFMVLTFANMFNELNYAVLFEGVEDENDEAHCMKMNARYLQGYKYSRPIPITELKKFLTVSEKV